MSDRIVILGGGYGGAIAAARMARRGIPVTLVDAKAGLVERIRMHQVIAGDDIAPVPYAQLFRGLPVEVVQARVTAIDRARKRVVTTDGELAYGTLVYALGSRSVTPPHAVSTNEATLARAKVRGARHVAIVGGGLTGIELASELAERHPQLDVTLIAARALGGDLSPAARRHLRGWFERRRVTLLEHVRATAADEGGVSLDTGEHVAAGVVLWAGGFTVPSIAAESGLRVNERGQIVVDEHLRSSDLSIYAIGDAAAVKWRMSCALALPMGAWIADHLSGATDEPFRFGFAARCISLGRHDGIVQFVGADDAPREKALTGRPAAWIKELICRYTILALRLERRGVPYRWPRSEAAA